MRSHGIVHATAAQPSCVQELTCETGMCGRVAVCGAMSLSKERPSTGFADTLHTNPITVLYRSGTRVTPNGTKKPVWMCQCECGEKTEVVAQSLKVGGTRSCGCLQKESMSSANRTHGMSNSSEYQSWRGMWERCTNPNNSHYQVYGGAGVVVSDKWKDFSAFLVDMGVRPEGTSLDRFPNASGNYEPGNCRWATAGEQSRNTSRTIYITWDGETLCRKDWAERLGITTVALKFRLKHWPLERTMTSTRSNRGRQNKAEEK